MRNRITAFALLAFMLGALSDVLLVRNGLALGGRTLLDRYPVIWPAWLAFVFVCSFLLELGLRHSPTDYSGRPTSALAHGTLVIPLTIPLAILLGMAITHSVLLIRDVIVDPTSHNLWPFEYIFWGFVIVAPAFIGSFLARLILNRTGLR
jgi:hypothetical protein